MDQALTHMKLLGSVDLIIDILLRLDIDGLEGRLQAVSWRTRLQ